MANHMRTLTSSRSAGKGDKPRPVDINKFRDNFDSIKKSCGCKFGKTCKCKKQS